MEEGCAGLWDQGGRSLGLERPLEELWMGKDWVRWGCGGPKRREALGEKAGTVGLWLIVIHLNINIKHLLCVRFCQVLQIGWLCSLPFISETKYPTKAIQWWKGVFGFRGLSGSCSCLWWSSWWWEHKAETPHTVAAQEAESWTRTVARLNLQRPTCSDLLLQPGYTF